MRLASHQVDEFLAFAHQLADRASAVTLPYFRTPTPVDDKGGRRYDPVTEADRTAEAAMRKLIQERYPTHGVLGEEEAPRMGSEPYQWVLDPIDGTRSFITGIPLWGTLIALNDGQRPRIGIMDQPYTRERFVGTPDGAWLNGRELAVRACTDLASASLMCTAFELFDDQGQRQVFREIADKARLVRFGGDCYAYCMLAMGMVDVVIEAGLKPYDVQALIPIVEGAGGVMTTWTGADAQHGGAIVACGNHRLHQTLVAQLAPCA